MNRVVPIDKPAGMTSHDVVSRLRRSSGVRRIGHAGTLDPSATGVLVVLVGKATRLSQFLVDTEKEYLGRIVLGVSTDTHDAEGTVVREMPVDGVTEDAVRRSLEAFTGEVDQVPPMTSAIKRGGRPLYELARKGIVVEREPRRVIVRRFDLLRYDPPDVEFSLTCSKGTYVRKLAADVGEVLGTGGHLGRLVRTRVGRFTLDEAIGLEEAERLGENLARAGLSMFEALSSWPKVILDERESESVMFGGALSISRQRLAAEEGRYVRLTGDGESLLAVGRVEGGRGEAVEVRPVKVFETV